MATKYSNVHPSNSSKSGQTEKLLQRLTDLEVENEQLNSTLSQIQSKYEDLLTENGKSLQQERMNVQQLVKDLAVWQNNSQRQNQELEQYMAENAALRAELEDQFKKNLKKSSLAELENEIGKIKDPKSFGILRRMMTEMSKLQNQIEQLQNQAIGERSKLEEVKQIGTSFKQKSVQMDGETRALRQKIDQLSTQNDFLLNELKFSQRKLKESSTKRGGTGSVQIAIGDTQESESHYKGLVKKVCQILSIKDESSLIDSVKTIETAYQFLPSLQITVENIYKIVTEGNIFETPINSYDDLAETVENWSMNLSDYKNLVDGLINILEIEDEENKTVNYILETVSQLVQGGFDGQSSQGKNRTESDNIHEMLEVTSKDQVLEKVAKMVTNSKSSRKDYFGHFLDIARDKLSVESQFTDEAVLSKILKLIDQSITKPI